MVILLHISGPWLYKLGGVNIMVWDSIAILHSFTRFCVPIFLMITGALLIKKEYNIKDFYKSKLSRIIVPLLFWSFFYIIIFISFDIFQGKQYDFKSIIQYSFNALINGAAYHLWYMYLIILLYLLIPIISNGNLLISKFQIWFFIIFWILVLFFAQFSSNNLIFINTRLFLGYFGYLILGIFISDLKITKRKAIVFSVVLISIGWVSTFYPVLRTFRDYNYVLNEWFYYLNVNVVILSVGVFLLIKNIELNWNWIHNIARHSFGIYFIHLFYIMVLNKILIFPIPVPLPIYLLIYATVVLALSYYSILFLSKIPIINKYIE